MEIRLHNSTKRVLIDSEDYAKISNYKWYYSKSNNRAITSINKKTVYMSQIILNSSMLIDHKNQNTLDNRRSNLRQCTFSQNNQNQVKRNGEFTSKYKGVHWNKGHKWWKAEIRVNKKYMHLGYFGNEIEAAKAYDIAAIKYFKEFAILNFPFGA